MVKDSPRTTAGELQKTVESPGQKTFRKLSNSTYITTCCLGGFQEKFSLIQKQSPAYSVVRHNWNFKWNWLLWSDEAKNKIAFLSENTQDGFSEHRDKKYPMCTMKYTAVCLMLWVYISAGSP